MLVWSHFQNFESAGGAKHYSDVIMSTMVSEISSVSVVCPTAGQRKLQSSAALASVRRINRWPVDSPHKGPVMRKIFPFDDVIMNDKKLHKLLVSDLSINVSFSFPLIWAPFDRLLVKSENNSIKCEWYISFNIIISWYSKHESDFNSQNVLFFYFKNFKVFSELIISYSWI